MGYACSGSPGVAATAVNVVTRRSVCLCCGRLGERFEESLEAVEAVSFPDVGFTYRQSLAICRNMEVLVISSQRTAPCSSLLRPFRHSHSHSHSRSRSRSPPIPKFQ